MNVGMLGRERQRVVGSAGRVDRRQGATGERPHFERSIVRDGKRYFYAEIYGDRARPNTMVLVEEVTDGGWGIGDEVLTLAKLQAGS